MTIRERTNRIPALVLTAAVAAVILMLSACPVHAAAKKPLEGKSVLIEGDSIQSGSDRYVEKAVWSMGAKRVKNPSTRAATVAWGRNKSNSTWYRVRGMSYSDIRRFSYIIITTGTNDYFRYYRVKPGSPESTDVKTTGGALNYVIKKIQRASPETKIVIVTPIHRFAGGTSCDRIKNPYGKTLADYRRVIVSTAKKYDNVYVIQGTSISRAGEMKKSKNTGDGLHPCADYQRKVLAKRFEAQFRKTVVDKPDVQPADQTAGQTNVTGQQETGDIL